MGLKIKTLVFAALLAGGWMAAGSAGAADVAPTINGYVNCEDTIEVPVGYETFFKSYTVVGSPSPSIGGNGENTLDAMLTSSSGTMTLRIPDGLAAGTYSTHLAATNSVGRATLKLTMIVGGQNPSQNLAVTPDNLRMTGKAETLTVSVTGTVSWNVSVGANVWLEVSPAFGSGNGSFTVTSAANTSQSARIATVTVSGGGFTRTISVIQDAVPSGPVVGQDVNNTLTVSKQTLGALSTKGVKLSVPAALAVPKGTVLYKGAKAVYTWKRDGTVVGTGKSLTVKQSGEYAVTLSYKRADGGTTTTTADIASVTIYAAPKIMSLRVSQTTDTLTSAALKNTSVVSGESLSLTVNIAQTAGAQFGPFNYKWYRGSALVKTQQSASASDTFVTPAYGDKADAYKVEVETVSRDPKNSSKPLAVAKSKVFKAKVILPPSAVTLKLSANPVKEGKPLTLSASAKGTSKLIFTWYKNDVPIATGSAKKFTKKPVTVSYAGVYYVVISQDKTNRRAQSSTLTVSIQRADGTIVSGAQPQSAPMTASPSAAALTSSVDPRRRDAAVTLSNSAASGSSASALNLAPLTLSAGDVLTLSGSAPREYIIVSETQHSTGAYRYEWRDTLTAEFRDVDAEAQLTLRFITADGGVYELSVSGNVGETGVFELRKK